MDKRDKLFFALISICIILLLGVILFMRSEKAHCIKNPFIYGAGKMKEVYCLCQQFKEENQHPITFWFNDTDFGILITAGH